MLYDKLDYLQEKLLYFDTDSKINIDDGTKNIITGDMLGELTDELSGEATTQFVTRDRNRNLIVLIMEIISKNQLLH